jgi:hypothetical protein
MWLIQKSNRLGLSQVSNYLGSPVELWDLVSQGIYMVQDD